MKRTETLVSKSSDTRSRVRDPYFTFYCPDRSSRAVVRDKRVTETTGGVSIVTCVERSYSNKEKVVSL